MKLSEKERVERGEKIVFAIWAALFLGVVLVAVFL